MKEKKRGSFLCTTALFLAVVCVSSGGKYTNRAQERKARRRKRKEKTDFFMRMCVCGCGCVPSMLHGLLSFSQLQVLQSGVSGGSEGG